LKNIKLPSEKERRQYKQKKRREEIKKYSSIPRRMMVKFNINEINTFSGKGIEKKASNYVNINLYSREFNSKKEFGEFMFSREQINEALAYPGKMVYDMVLHDFAGICYLNKTEQIYFTFTFLHSAGNNKVEGRRESVYIPAISFLDFFTEYKPGSTLRLLNYIDHKPTRIIFHLPKGYILSMPKMIKKKLKKGIMQLSNYREEEIDIFPDFAPYSFFWRCKNSSLHGGLIFHHDYKDYNNLSKGYYSIHT